MVRPHYTRRACESQGHDPRITRASQHPEPIPRSGIGFDLLARVIVSKFIDHLPPHRQEVILARDGWDVRRSTPCDHLRTSGEVAFLAECRGFVHADAYDGYNAVHNNIRHLGCWRHARRDFVDAQPTDPRAVEALAFIRTLYAFEREIKDDRASLGARFIDADVVRVRKTRAGPILAAFADWLDLQSRSPTPKSLFGQAVGSARNQWASLVRHLDDAWFAIDNGGTERAMRPLAVSRANWLHVGGDGGLKTASVLLRVCASATRHKLDQWSDLRDVLDHLANRSRGADLSDLLPDALTQAPANGRMPRAA